MTAPVCAVLNMKGGVGKTTLTANLAREILSGKRISILLVDLDPQFNLTQQLMTSDTYEKAVEDGRTVLRLFEPAPVSDFFNVNVSKSEPPKARDIAYSLRWFVKTPEVQIALIPGSFELTKYSFIEDGTKLNHAKEFFKRFISEAKKSFDLVLLDMNPSSSFLTFAGLSVATDVLSPVKPDKFSMLGLSLVKRLLEHKALPNVPRMHIVMNAVGRAEGITGTETEIRSVDFFKDCILSNRVYQSKVLAARPDYTGFASDRPVAHRRTISAELRAAGVELVERMGL